MKEDMVPALEQHHQRGTTAQAVDAPRSSSRVVRLVRFPSGTLQRLRFAFMVFGLSNCVIIGFTGALTTPDVMQQWTILGGGLALAAHWLLRYSRPIGPAWDVLEVVVVAVVLSNVGAIERGLGIMYTGLFYGSLYGSQRRAAIRGGALLAAFLFAMYASHMLTAQFAVPQVFGAVMAVGTMRIVYGTTLRQDRTLKRERLLRELAESLASAPDDPAMRQAISSALLGFIGSNPTIRASFLQGTAEDMQVVASWGAEADQITGASVHIDMLPADLRSDLASGVPVKRRVSSSGAYGPALSFDSKLEVMLAPVMVSGELNGILSLASDQSIPDDLMDSLRMTASQVGMWLERKRADEAAKIAEVRYRVLVQHAADVVALLSPAGEILYVSPSIKTMLGYLPEELHGVVGFSFVHEEDAAAARQALAAALDGRGPVTFTVRVQRRDGEWRWHELTASSMLGTPELEGIVINARDVTASRNARVALRDRADAMAAAAAVGSAMTSSRDLASSLNVALRAVLSLGLSAAHVWTAEPDSSQFVLRASAPGHDDLVPDEIDSRRRDPLAGIPIQTHGDWSQSYPLVVDERQVGLLWTSGSGELSVTATETLEAIADLIAVGVDRKRTEAELRRHVDLLEETDRARRTLLRRIVTVQEEERKAIAADIHDDSVQEMAAVAIRLGLLRRHVEGEAATALVDRLEANVTDSIARLRELMFNLRPPTLDRDGLESAVREHLDAVASESGFTWEVVSTITPQPATETDVQTFRVFQEAIANVRKHADATHVRARLEQSDGGVLVEICDNGKGFDVNSVAVPERGHLGLTSMQQRIELTGGTWTIESQPGAGTTLRYVVPSLQDGGDAS